MYTMDNYINYYYYQQTDNNQNYLSAAFYNIFDQPGVDPGFWKVRGPGFRISPPPLRFLFIFKWGVRTLPWIRPWSMYKIRPSLYNRVIFVLDYENQI